jgi:hypothetical protein
MTVKSVFYMSAIVPMMLFHPCFPFFKYSPVLSYTGKKYKLKQTEVNMICFCVVGAPSRY